MSVGGTVVEIIDLPDRVWVNTDEARSYDAEGGRVIIPSRECAIYVERTPEARSISEGDSVWWQGEWAMWTPKSRPFEDKRLRRIGCSGVGRPQTEQ
jgi:hypothetical protein